MTHEEEREVKKICVYHRTEQTAIERNGQIRRLMNKKEKWIRKRSRSGEIRRLMNKKET